MESLDWVAVACSQTLDGQHASPSFATEAYALCLGPVKELRRRPVKGTSQIFLVKYLMKQPAVLRWSQNPLNPQAALHVYCEALHVDVAN